LYLCEKHINIIYHFIQECKFEFRLNLLLKMSSESNHDIQEWLLDTYGKFMHLTVYIDSKEAEFIEKYKEHIASHNQKLKEEINYVNAGFDLLTPRDIYCTPDKINKISMEIKCAASIIHHSSWNGGVERYYNTGYYMYPRSSISKTPLRLANSVGIIDSGYRGPLIGMFDMITRADIVSPFQVSKYDRLLQICSPDLLPIFVKWTDDLSELGVTTRGEGGFGSTGK
jgi:dUTPase